MFRAALQMIAQREIDGVFGGKNELAAIIVQAPHDDGRVRFFGTKVVPDGGHRL
ncbi:MAG: hypothetical protein LBV74_00155 [Tannerella sp.]|jgi:hypothetical protein|nr:hypothetical protein [Tannerella sp.]